MAKVVAVLITALILSGLLPVPAAKAQTASGTFEGKVVDAAGAPLANVKVTVINQNNGNTRATITNAEGYYRVPFLVPGIYRIVAELPGYTQSQSMTARIPLNTSTIPVPPITLIPGTGTPTTPTTTPTTPPPTTTTTTTTPPPTTQQALDTERTSIVNISDPTRRGNFIDRQVETLPLGGATVMRTFDEYALLLPGVAPPPYTPGVRGPGVGFGIGTAGQFAVNGLRARSNNFTVDGSDNNDPDVGVRRQGFVALVPQSIESIREFQVSTLLWDAENGRNFGSQVNAVSKDGGNRMHGQVYGFFTDSALNARNFFDIAQDEDPFTRVQAGLVIGGPMFSNRTQYFGSFERLDINQSIEQQFATPRAADRRFLGLNQFGVLRPGPNFLANQTFLTTLGTTPLGRNLLSFYPSPNNPAGPFGDNNFTETLPADGDGTIFSYKLTHQFNPNNTLNARYNFTDDNRTLPSVNRALRSTLVADTRTQDLSLIFDTQLSPIIFNQARFPYGRTRLDFQGITDSPFLFNRETQEDVSIGNSQTRLPSTTGSIGEILVEPISPVGVNATTFPQSRVNDTFQFADSLSWTAGSHSIKLGADIRRLHLNSLIERNFRPQVVVGYSPASFGTLSQTGNLSDPFRFTGRNSFVLSGAQVATVGQVSSFFQSITVGPADASIALRSTEYNFFFNDSWRVRPNFTLDYGMRYEYNTVPREKDDRIESALRLETLPVPGDSAANSAARTSAFNSAVEGYRSFLGGRDKIYDPDRNNFGPHVGFAWDVTRDGRTSIRAGYGVYFDAILGAVVSQSRNVFPNEVALNIAPAFAILDVFVLNNPVFFTLGEGGIPLIAPGTPNQLGGTSADAVGLLGELFIQSRGLGGLAFTLPEKELRTPYAQHWHLSIDREIFRDYMFSAAYVGTKATKLTRLTTPNLGPNVTSPFLVADQFGTGFPPGFTSPPLVLADCSLQANRRCSILGDRPNPNLGAIQVFENSAASNYHALQLEARRRYSRNYTFTLAYTYSHAIDDVSDVFPISGAPVIAQDSFNLRGERASANFDARHRFAASLIWDLPFFSDSQTTAARVFGGWQVASIFQAQTGQPFTINLPIDANLDGNLTDRPSTSEGLIFFDGHGPRRVAVAQGRTLTDFFVLGQAGAVGRNTVRADNFINLDVAINKSFRLTESQNIQFRAEFFNALNRANFGIPIRTLDSPGFGRSIETANPARIIQFALKYSF
jgi:hypothetical protein